MTDARHPPTPDGYPVLGNAVEFASDPIVAMESWASTGDVVELSLPGQSMYVVMHPSAIEDVLVEHHDKFSIGPAQRETFAGVEDHAITTTTGDRWARLRRALRPAFTRDAVDRYAERMAATTAAYVDTWADGERIDLHAELRKLTVQLLADALLDVDASGDEAVVVAASDALVDRADFSRPGQLLPDWVPTPTDRRFERRVRELDEYVADVLADTRAGPSGGDSSGVDPDGENVCSVLLAAHERGELTRDEVRHNVVGLLLAGHESPGLALTYAWYLLSDHPDVYADLVAEYDDVVDGDHPGPGAFDRLERTRNVVAEALRLYPPTTGVNREATEQVTVGGYELPAGAQVLVPQWVPHRDGRWWRNPETFDPSRWRRDADRPEYAYFPYSGGPRYCIGMQLARRELTLALATMVGRVDLDVTAPDPLSFRPTVALRPNGEFSATVRRRG